MLQSLQLFVGILPVAALCKHIKLHTGTFQGFR
jgi:hypothetical protein